MARIDKLIVTNVSALHSKYGSSGLSAIRSAVDALIAADAVRGLTTQLVDIASPRQMRAVRAKAVVDPDVRKPNKDAIDAAGSSVRRPPRCIASAARCRHVMG